MNASAPTDGAALEAPAHLHQARLAEARRLRRLLRLPRAGDLDRRRELDARRGRSRARPALRAGLPLADFTSRSKDILKGFIESLTMTLTSTVAGGAVILSIPVGIGAARNIAPLPIYGGLPGDRGRVALLPGDHHRDPARRDVRVRSLRRLPDADLRHDRIHGVSCSRRTSRTSTRPRPRPCAPPARAGGRCSTTASSPRSCRGSSACPCTARQSIFANRRSSASSARAASAAPSNVAMDRYEYDTRLRCLMLIILIVMAAEYSSSWLRKRIQ